MSYTHTMQQDELHKAISSSGLDIVTPAIAGSGKEQPLTSMILTPTGWNSMANMRIGTLVMSPNTGINTVIGVHPQGVKRVYELTFNDGTTAECGLNHLWVVRTTDNSSWHVMSLKEILKASDEANTGAGFYEIPLATVDYPSVPTEPTIDPITGLPVSPSITVSGNLIRLPIEPYLFGSMLGDTLYEASYGVFSEVEHVIKERAKTFPQTTQETNKELGKLGLWGLKESDRYIPEEYLNASFSDRLALLRGLNDTEAVRYSKRGCTVSTGSYALANDIVSIARSLGGFVTMEELNRNYEITMRFNELSPFLALVKEDVLDILDINNGIEKDIADEQYRKTIVSIERTNNKVEQQCISLDGDNLYITNGYTTTHNTYSLLRGVHQLCKNKPKEQVQIVCYNKHNSMDIKGKVKDLPNLAVNTFHSLAMRNTHFEGSVSFKNVATSIGYQVVRNVKLAKPTSDLIRKIAEMCVVRYLRTPDKVIKFPKSRKELNHLTTLRTHQPSGSPSPKPLTENIALGKIISRFSSLSKLHSMGGEYDLLEGGIANTFDTLLKRAIMNDEIFRGANTVVLEEFGDINELMLYAITRAKDMGKRIITAGDSMQSLYMFSGGLTDPLRRLKEAVTLVDYPLTNSFRCPDKVIQHALSKYNNKFPLPAYLKNSKGVQGRLPDLPEHLSKNTTVLSNTNKNCIEQAFEYHNTGYQVHSPDLVALIEKLRTHKGREYSSIYDPSIRQDSYEALLEAFNAPYVPDKPICQFMTIFKAKGLEFNQVSYTMAETVNVSALENELMGYSSNMKAVQTANLHYVAATRTKHTLKVKNFVLGR